MELYGYEFIRESDLTHHGIKGQKWGVRRYQNPDGTLTAAGKKKYSAIGDRATNRAIRKGATIETASRYGNSVAKREAQFDKTVDSKERVERALLLSPKRWKTWHNDYKDYQRVRKETSALKDEVKKESVENKIAKRYERRGTSPDKAREVGKLYAERMVANKNYSKAYDEAYRGMPFGKKYTQRVEKMVESLNDYYIADDNYQIAKIQANAEARRSKGWR